MMSILIIDCDPDRRPLIEARIRLRVPPATVRATDAYVPPSKSATLVLWHVGDRQYAHERGRMGSQLHDVLAAPRNYVAGFTGGIISREVAAAMPGESERFVINRTASGGEMPDQFGKAVDRVIDVWVSREGRLDAGQLAIAWLGTDPLLEAKLDVLASLLSDAPGPSQMCLRLLARNYPSAFRPDGQLLVQQGADYSSIAKLRSLFFQE